MPAGRPRDSAVDARILAAVYQLLLTTRISGVTMDAVAAAAGVGKPTIYRRWPSKDELVIDALATHAPQAQSVVGGVMRDDLVAIVEHLMLAPDVGGRHLLAMVDHATGDPQLARALWERVLRPRHDEIGRLLEDAKAAGTVRADADLETTVALVLGATLAAGVLKAIGGGSAAPEDNAHVAAERIVDCLWFGLKGAGE